jgi:exodeoxyribonuclease-5
VFHLFGYAGTGKTTLAKHLVQGMNNVMFGAYTGKAAHVLRQKGCDGAQTIHSMIYRSRDKSAAHLKQLMEQLDQLTHELRSEGFPDEQILEHKKVRELKGEIKKERSSAEQPFFTLNNESEVKNADVVVIDECSMVDGQLGQDLLSFGTPVLVLGDPAQLPPVGGEGYFTKGVNPDVMLTEIHRQAADNPIIRMATDVRHGKFLEIGEYGGNCRVRDKTKMDPEEILSFNQVLVGKNVTRFGANRRIRHLRGIDDPYPIVGDRLVCLKNNSESGLLNGAIFEVTGIDGVMDEKVHMSVRPEDGEASIDVMAHHHHFVGKQDELSFFEKKEAMEFDYGYALTVHKSQGSQWSKVCVMDEAYCFRAEKFKWLYTAITRAADEVTIIKM